MPFELGDDDAAVAEGQPPRGDATLLVGFFALDDGRMPAGQFVESADHVPHRLSGNLKRDLDLYLGHGAPPHRPAGLGPWPVKRTYRINPVGTILGRAWI